MFEFAWPWAFALLPLPWLIALIAGKQKHHSTLMLLIHALAHMGMTNTKVTPSRKWPHWLLAIVWALVVASAANPVFVVTITLSEPAVTLCWRWTYLGQCVSKIWLIKGDSSTALVSLKRCSVSLLASAVAISWAYFICRHRVFTNATNTRR